MPVAGAPDRNPMPRGKPTYGLDTAPTGGGGEVWDPFAEAGKSAATEIDKAFQGIDVASAVGPSIDAAAAAVDAATDRMIAARARLQAAWSKPLPTPAAPGTGVRVDTGQPVYDAMGNTF
jgi:hypothetical protein